MKINEIPSEVFLRAVEIDGLPCWNNLELAQENYNLEKQKYGAPNQGIEQAVHEYLSRTGAFADGERFSGCALNLIVE